MNVTLQRYTTKTIKISLNIYDNVFFNVRNIAKNGAVLLHPFILPRAEQRIFAKFEASVNLIGYRSTCLCNGILPYQSRYL